MVTVAADDRTYSKLDHYSYMLVWGHFYFQKSSLAVKELVKCLNLHLRWLKGFIYPAGCYS